MAGHRNINVLRERMGKKRVAKARARAEEEESELTAEPVGVADPDEEMSGPPSEVEAKLEERLPVLDEDEEDEEETVPIRPSRRNEVKAEDPPSFVEEDAFFVRNAGTLHLVDSKRSLLQALNDKNELVKIYIRKNKFRFKKNMEKELVKTAAYYSALKG